jgi:hypothetical protein
MVFFSVLSRSAKRTEPSMRTIINRNTQIDVLANRQDSVVVAADDVLRTVMLAQPISGQFFQACASYAKALKRAGKPAIAGAARAAETTLAIVVSGMRGLSRSWHTQRVMPHLAVVRVGS